MVVAIDISEDQAEKLSAKAEQLGITPEALARAAVIDLLDRKEDFSEAAAYVLSKNAELYKRLS